jgi:hypothetical protein
MTTTIQASMRKRKGIFVFIVRHRTESRFQLGQNRLDESGELPLQADVDPTTLLTLRFTNAATTSRAEAVLRTLLAETRVVVDDSSGFWIDASAVPKLREHILPALATWFDAEFTDRAATQAEVSMDALEPRLADELLAKKWVSPGANTVDCAEYLCWILSRLDEVSALLFAEGSGGRPEKLFFEAGPDAEAQALEICDDLRALYVCSRDPLADGFDVPSGACPFGPIQRGRFMTVAGPISGWMLPVEPSEPFFDRLLVGLAPRIPGWDLPASAASPREGAQASQWMKERVSEQLWRLGSSPLNERVISYLGTVGVTLKWKPFSLRFIEKSPLPEDADAPVLLVRLYNARGDQVGVQRIRLDTRQRKLYLVTPAEDVVCARIWRPRPRMLLATVLEDVLALNEATRKPAVLVPGKVHLARFGLEAGVEAYDVFLPSESDGGWLEAAQAFRERAAEQGVEVSVFRLPQQAETEGANFWWKALVDARSKGLAGLEPFEVYRVRGTGVAL